ncbi:MAG TPA: carboxypeptidase regulatory-like domain-containing protein [Gemmatimonadales bacterium]|nr:carboxypeptidase regulatory-like domain-containing protein [Gemmatimonadales bacterium]
MACSRNRLIPYAGWLLLLGFTVPGGRSVAQADSHVVRGRVVDVVTGAPVVRAEVFVLGRRRPVRTDAAGQFRHERLAPVSYLLRVQKPGYLTMTWEVAAVDDTSLVHVFELHPLRAESVSGRAGTAFIQGRVVDRETETPLGGTEVLVMGRPEAVTTDSAGRFRHEGLAATSHVLRVRKLGYEAMTVELTAVEDSIVWYLVDLPRSAAIMLDSIVVTGVADEPSSYWHREFETRRREGRGQFVTRREIEHRRAASLGDLLRTLNGLRMFCNRQGCEVRMTRTNCRPAYFADGYPADASTVERMPVDDVFGVEVYDLFEVPVQLQRAELRCGVIAVWTRRGPPPR